MKKVILGAPVKGLQLKETLTRHLSAQGWQVIDVGTRQSERFVKYPSVGERVAYALQQELAPLAINLCGSGTGAAISAGKFRGVLACACESEKTARLIRVVNGANCLCMGEDVVSPELACAMADAFLGAEFQDNPSVRPEVRAFWSEAQAEMAARGAEATDRELEYLD